LKNDFLDFPRYSGYSIQARWATVQANDAKFPQDLTHQKSLKSVNFSQSYLKNKKGDVFWDTVYIHGPSSPATPLIRPNSTWWTDEYSPTGR